MPQYQLYRLIDSRREKYQSASPEPGQALLRGRHYEPAGEVEAVSPYQAWRQLQTVTEEAETLAALAVGDVLRDPDRDEWLVCNYWGFDPVQWNDDPPLTIEQMQALT
jgi:hypothetical protein